MKLLTLLLAVLALSSCGKSLTPVQAAAAQTCKDTIEARAINRKTVDYSAVDVTPAVAPAAKGQLNATIKFTAKNEIGMASFMLANCTVSADGKTLIGIQVKETR